MSNSFLSELERGIKKAVGSDILISLKREFGISSDWLLCDEYQGVAEGSVVIEESPGYRDEKIVLLEATQKQHLATIRKLERDNARLRGQLESFREILSSMRK